MTPEELKELEAEHAKAMEAMQAFTKEAKATINLGKKQLGLK